MPVSTSAACCTTAPASVTGAVAPASGTEMISAGTPARASCTRFSPAKSVQWSGADGQTSKIARGFARSASTEPASAASRSIIRCVVVALKAPVTTGLFEYQRTRKSR